MVAAELDGSLMTGRLHDSCESNALPNSRPDGDGLISPSWPDREGLGGECKIQSLARTNAGDRPVHEQQHQLGSAKVEVWRPTDPVVPDSNTKNVKQQKKTHTAAA